MFWRSMAFERVCGVAKTLLRRNVVTNASLMASFRTPQHIKKLVCVTNSPDNGASRPRQDKTPYYNAKQLQPFGQSSSFSVKSSSWQKSEMKWKNIKAKCEKLFLLTHLRAWRQGRQGFHSEEETIGTLADCKVRMTIVASLFLHSNSSSDQLRASNMKWITARGPRHRIQMHCHGKNRKATWIA